MKKEQLYLTISTAIIIILVISTAVVLNQKNQEIKELESLNDELSTQNFLLKTEVGDLKGEMESQQMVTEHFVYLWEQMEGLHPKDAKRIKHETE
jgi:hypothetical protein